jgi:hypothetical protein
MSDHGLPELIGMPNEREYDDVVFEHRYFPPIFFTSASAYD